MHTTTQRKGTQMYKELHGRFGTILKEDVERASKYLHFTGDDKTDYTSIVILFPFAIIASNLFSSIIGNKLEELTQNLSFLASLSLNILRFSHIVTTCFFACCYLYAYT